MTVEVFKTNVKGNRQAKELLELMQMKLADCIINFDLEDCDKILRVETNGGCEDLSQRVISLLTSKGFFCEELAY
ncbi:hypothetical protein LZF95_17200 [Algoriphagus sp. AGSA1]|nr:hypothetical protein [Algoriphagus sp. AGSA1]